jgi:16S rRNA (guanine527-N7)-methyltransferase
MDRSRIAALLAPFVPSLDHAQLDAISTYLHLLLRWNARINLTAVRTPDQIVTRHFGESLFTAAHLLENATAESVIDVGSGAGFPGLPLKIYARQLRLTLIESQQRKATFLREVVRALHLPEVHVFPDRAEKFAEAAELVTLRAVERFEEVLAIAALLVSPGGRLALLIGAAQSARARQLLPSFNWKQEIAVPQSSARVLLVGRAGDAAPASPR